MSRAEAMLARQARPHVGGAILLGLVAILLVSPAAARQEAPWCANSTGFGMNYRNCTLPSLEACRQEILGMGGWCQPNPYYTPPKARPEPVRKRKPRPRH